MLGRLRKPRNRGSVEPQHTASDASANAVDSLPDAETASDLEAAHSWKSALADAPDRHPRVSRGTRASHAMQLTAHVTATNTSDSVSGGATPTSARSAPAPAPSEPDLEAAPAPAPAAAPAAEGSGSSSALTDVPPLRLTPWGAFPDAAVEATYRRTDLRPRLTARVRFISSVFMVLGGGIVVMDIVPRGGITTISKISGFLWLTDIVMFLLSSAVRAWARVPLAALEWSSAIWLCLFIVNMVVFYPYRLAQLLPDESGVILGNSTDCEWSQAAAMLRALAIVVVAGLFMPLQHAHFFLVVGVSLVSTTVAELLLPLPSGRADAARTGAVFFLLVATIARAHWDRVRSERAQWHFRRSVAEATQAWQRTRKLELDAKIRASSAELAKAARAKLIRVVMHDLRSPLLACKNVADMLSATAHDSLVGAPPTQRAVDTLHTCTTIMENIVSDMLDFERIDSGRLNLVPGPFRFAKLLKDAETTFANLAQRKGVRLSFRKLPPEAADKRFVGDVRRLLQCLSNGLSNAIKFTDPGKRVTMRVSVRPHPTRSAEWRHIVLSVEDEGIGLTDDELEALNAPEGEFTQVGLGQLQGNGGTGLGLSIARHLLRLHWGSTLRLTSAGRGRGTTFEMNLTLALASDDAAGGGSAGDSGAWSFRPAAGVPAIQRDRSDSSEVSSRPSTAANTPSMPSRLSLGRTAGGAGGADGSGGTPGRARLARLPSDRATNGTRSSCYGSTHSSLSAEQLQALAEAGEVRLSGGAADEDALLAGLKCLHVEDDQMLQLTVGVQLFSRLGIAHDTAADGRACVALVRASLRPAAVPYDAIVMDNQMPEMTGTQATREIRALGFSGIIIGMTGDPIGSPDRSEFEAAGLDMCTDKTTEGMGQIEARLRQYAATTSIIASARRSAA